MQGVHAFDPKAKSSIDLESFVAEDHFLLLANKNRGINHRPDRLERF